MAKCWAWRQHRDITDNVVGSLASCSLQPRPPLMRRDPRARVRRTAGFADRPQVMRLPTELLCRVSAPGQFAAKVATRDCCPLHPDNKLITRASKRVWTKRRYSQRT